MHPYLSLMPALSSVMCSLAAHEALSPWFEGTIASMAVWMSMQAGMKQCHGSGD